MTTNSCPPGQGPGFFYRGATLRFQTTFYDYDDNVEQPTQAMLALRYSTPAAEEGITTEIAMTPPPPGSVLWTAFWDTRDVEAPATVWWSIFTPGPNPVAVEDGQLRLLANPANQITF